MVCNLLNCAKVYNAVTIIHHVYKLTYMMCDAKCRKYIILSTCSVCCLLLPVVNPALVYPRHLGEKNDMPRSSPCDMGRKPVVRRCPCRCARMHRRITPLFQTGHELELAEKYWQRIPEQETRLTSNCNFYRVFLCSYECSHN